MRKLKSILAAVLAAAVMAACNITAFAGELHFSEDISTYDYEAKVIDNDGVIYFVDNRDSSAIRIRRYPYDLGIEFITEDGFDTSTINCDYEILDGAPQLVTLTDNTHCFVVCSYETVTDEKIDEMNELLSRIRKTDGVKSARIFKRYSFNNGSISKYNGSAYIRLPGSGALDLEAIKSDTELWNYLETIGADPEINTELGTEAYPIWGITGIDLEQPSDIFAVRDKINTFSSIENKAELQMWVEATYCPMVYYADEPYVVGDIDGDGKASAHDASMAFSEYKQIYINGKGSFTDLQLKSADMNGDGKITAADASKIFTLYKASYKK